MAYFGQTNTTRCLCVCVCGLLAGRDVSILPRQTRTQTNTPARKASCSLWGLILIQENHCESQKTRTQSKKEQEEEKKKLLATTRIISRAASRSCGKIFVRNLCKCSPSAPPGANCAGVCANNCAAGLVWQRVGR